MAEQQPAPKRTSKATTGCLLALAAFMGSSLLVGVLLLVLLYVKGGDWAAEAFTEPEPLASDHPTSAEPAGVVRDRLVADLRSETRTARLTGPELTALLRDQLGDKGRGGVTVGGGLATLDLSIDLSEPGQDPQWMTLHAKGSLTLEKGWVTAAHVEALDLSGWSVGPFLNDDKELVVQSNRQLADLRGEEPDLGAKLDAIERLTVDGDAVVITMTPDGVGFVQGGP